MYRNIPISGGTMKFKICFGEDKWLTCHACEEFFSKHYYVHQCDPYKIYCMRCLINKKKCKKCKTKYYKLLKANLGLF